MIFRSESASNGTAGAEGIIEQVLPRVSRLYRPPVANVDQLVVVMALKNPNYDWQLISRLLVLAEKESLAACLCFNKIDLLDASAVEKVRKEIEPLPYQIIFTSARQKTGLARLQAVLKDRCTVLAGPSGAGKSSLLNAIQPGLTLQTGIVSEKIKRGRHTTRQAELMPLDGGGTVVDTPGFTRLDFRNLAVEQLADLFPEFHPYIDQCAFRNCRHLTEPDCAVVSEVGSSINPLRYRHYSYFAEEIGTREVY